MARGRWRLVCFKPSAIASNIQRQLAISTTSYAERADVWLPGINTTGMRLSKGLRHNPDIINQFADLPTQDVDWMSPILADAELPTVRAARMYQLFDRFADPALPGVGRHAELYTGAYERGPSGLEDMQNWMESKNHTHLTATSYLMPIAFQLFGGSGISVSNNGHRYWTRYGQYSTRFRPSADDAILARSYSPRLTKIGSPAVKIANATGLRYYNGDGKITTNTAFAPVRVGSFATWGAIYTGSQSYGQAQPNTSGQDHNQTNGKQSPIVYRHRGKIIAAFFDGHAELLDVKESQNPSLWYPRGSEMGIRGRSIEEHAFSYVEEGIPIP